MRTGTPPSLIDVVRTKPNPPHPNPSRTQPRCTPELAPQPAVPAARASSTTITIAARAITPISRCMIATTIQR